MNTTRTPKVLAVDDRTENLLALEAILAGLPIEITSVTSGDDALKRLLTDDFAVVLMDAQMPGMDGFETAGHIKNRERTRHIPILFLTAVDYDSHLAFRGYQAGAVDYITKPFDPWVLRSKITIFADLWRLNAELTQRATERDHLRGAIDDALALLAGPPADNPLELLAQIRTRLAGPGHTSAAEPGDGGSKLQRAHPGS